MTNSIFYNGTWSFLNGGTQVQVVNSLGVFTSTILRLDTKRYEWEDVGGNTFGEEIPQ